MTSIAKIFSIIATFAFLIFVTMQIAFADDFKIAGLEIMHPHARVPLSNARNTGGYLSIKNNGTIDDKLIAIKVDFAEKAELHEMKMAGDIMKMRPLENGIIIPAGQTITLVSGGNHVMFMGLKEKLQEGDKHKGILIFEEAGEVEVQFEFESFSKIKKRTRMVRIQKMNMKSMGHKSIQHKENSHDNMEHEDEQDHMKHDAHDDEKHHDESHHDMNEMKHN